MKATKRGKTLVIELPLEQVHESASGKTLLVASTHGVRPTSIDIDGRPLQVVANAFIYPDRDKENTGQRKREQSNSK